MSTAGGGGGGTDLTSTGFRRCSRGAGGCWGAVWGFFDAGAFGAEAVVALAGLVALAGFGFLAGFGAFGGFGTLIGLGTFEGLDGSAGLTAAFLAAAGCLPASGVRVAFLAAALSVRFFPFGGFALAAPRCLADLSVGPERGLERKDLARETRGFVAFSLLRAISVHALNDALGAACRRYCCRSAALGQPLTLNVAMVYSRFSEFRQLRAGWKGLRIGFNRRGRIGDYTLLQESAGRKSGGKNGSSLARAICYGCKLFIKL